MWCAAQADDKPRGQSLGQMLLSRDNEPLTTNMVNPDFRSAIMMHTMFVRLVACAATFFPSFSPRLVLSFDLCANEISLGGERMTYHGIDYALVLEE